VWRGRKERDMMPWVNWCRLSNPKNLGKWGLKNIQLSGKVLAVKSLWRLFKEEGSWHDIMRLKYIESFSFEEWIRKEPKTHQNCSIVWKALVEAFVQ
jgi:hypothetical protein